MNSDFVGRCRTLLARERWLTPWEDNFLESNIQRRTLAPSDAQQEIITEIDEDTISVSVVGDYRVSELITYLVGVLELLPEEDADLVSELHEEGATEVGKRVADRLLRWAKRYVL